MKKIPEATIRRLSIYLRFLERVKTLGIETISSVEFANRLKLNPAQVRKDLSYFGEFGQKGVGYDIEGLIQSLRTILNLKEKVPVCLVGTGHLGQALCNYNLYQKDNMEIVAVFDSDDEKIGTKINNLTVQSTKNLQKVAKKEKIKIGIICVPHSFAQEVADNMVLSGISNLLNFAPIPLQVPDHVRVHDVDFTAELHSLAFFLE